MAIPSPGERSQSHNWTRVLIVVGTIAAVLVIVAFIRGPAGMINSYRSWTASAYGSDWYVIQYAQSGCVIAEWRLHDAAVDNEPNSDGIYFISKDNVVVHLSGHYTYVENPNDAAIDKLRGVGPCAPPET